MIKELTCIGCPLGCMLTVKQEGDQLQVSGNTCPRGRDYAVKEMTCPTRIVTSSVRLEQGTIPRVSVKTERDIPKGKMFEVMEQIHGASIKAPVHIGDVVIADCGGTGVNVIATKNVGERLP